MSNETRRILLVEDEKAIRDAVTAYLERENYWVTAVGDGQEALEEFSKHHFDLVILDLMLPRVPGERVCRAIRDNSDVPIIMLTALDDDDSQMKGFDALADDYITKPFGMMEFVARVKAVLRRCARQNEERELHCKDLRVNVARHEVSYQGELKELTRKEFELLEYLLENKGLVMSRNQILCHVWGYDFDGETRTVDVHVRTLRQKLGEAGNLIETVRGVGYRIGDHL